MIQESLVNVTQGYAKMKDVWAKIKPNIMRGTKYTLVLKSFEEAKTDQQRKYYHGFILLEISKQAVVNGRKYSLDVWKEYYRKKYLDDEIIDVVDVLTGVVTREVRRVSTESLSVKQYNKLIEQVTADAATEFGVEFNADFLEWVYEHYENL